VFPQAIKSPPLVPEEIDEETPLPAEEVTFVSEATTLVERVTGSENFMVVEYDPACPPEDRAEPRAPEIAA